MEKLSYKFPIMKTLTTDILVIGSGVAGLGLALKMAETTKITILSKYKATESSSNLAQGGIASVSSQDDSFDKHIEDTLNAGAGLCRREVVENIIRQGPERINDLIQWGVKFDSSLNREGGHREARVLHVKDHTGNIIHSTLLKRAREHKNIEILEDHFAIDLLSTKRLDPHDLNPNTCIGCNVFDVKNQEVIAIKSKVTILATGGAGRIYLYTSNWTGATGDGIAMAYRAGARVANLEFMQFHPTCLYHPEARNFLLTEALRGEGAKLINSSGEEFMQRYHEMGTLAPRDIVARSMDAEIKKSGHPCVYLDISHKPAEEIRERFPTIYKQCLNYGIDITRNAIPVVPAAHYLCGGVLSDITGKTDVTNLFAIGETACNGLHGANRLASNSLLECLATAQNTAEFLKDKIPTIPISPLEIDAWKNPPAPTHPEMVVIAHLWQEIRTLMWNYMGIVRTTFRLQRALKRLQIIQEEIAEYYRKFPLHQDILECRNIALMATLSVRCALMRKESVGIHYNEDLPPTKNKNLEDSIIR